MADVSDYNAAIESWAVKTASKMNSEMSSLGVIDTGNLFRKLRARVRLFLGEADSIGFKMPRYGILIDKGAGRGSNLGGSNGAAFGSIARKPKPWFSNSLNESSMNELADIVARHQGKMEAKEAANIAAEELLKHIKVRK